MSGRDRFLRSLEGEDLAFAPIAWERLPALVHQEHPDWWQDPAVGQRLLADAAALAGADAMFVCVVDEAVRSAVASGLRGDSALDGLAAGEVAQRGAELVAALRAIAPYGVIAAVPAPASLQRELGGEDLDAAEDVFSDFVSGQLEAGADAVAVTGTEAPDVNAGMDRAVRLAQLYSRRLLAVCTDDHGAKAWDDQGEALGVISAEGEWPNRAAGVVITPGDVSARWDATRLRAVGMGRPAGIPTR